ncbi:hypothetical protein PMIT1313_00922 [Prochlorococcus marinus str. MIT 1313]|uniref:hypothetical protein n=1 Tax=Prochlorococcus TaxID=1218 RepID=UPI0007B3C5BA|nr:hypothetical protein [Prochlorococcus marinus]KZR69815.1 hypothetical protein PMIT1313_00922 [Prochlorococcus marinus str. MIT 1313]KZR72163.1 hypothetical protein PMIT1318_01221 [Prochlorococcus marinus str. MIT 1318]
MLDVQQGYRYCVTTLLSLWQMQGFFDFQDCLEVFVQGQESLSEQVPTVLNSLLVLPSPAFALNHLPHHCSPITNAQLLKAS